MHGPPLLSARLGAPYAGAFQPLSQAAEKPIALSSRWPGVVKPTNHAVIRMFALSEKRDLLQRRL